MAQNFRLVGGRLALPDGQLVSGTIDVTDGTIEWVYFEDVPARDIRTVDVSGRIVAPGYIDIHLNGGMGETFEDADGNGIARILDLCAQHGTTSVLGTINTAPLDVRLNSLERLHAWFEDNHHPVEFLGAYLEGPYYNPDQRGAHPIEWMRTPNPDEYGVWLDRFGDLVRVISLAPELPGALEMIRDLSRRGVVPAMGHSMATDVETSRGLNAGARLVTHLYNAQSSYYRGDDYKHLGMAEVALMRDELFVEIIPDGHHLTPAMLTFVMKMKPRGQICITTDAMHATGLGPGDYTLMGQPVWVDDEVAYREDRKRHAGSILTMDRGVRNVLAAGTSIGEALRMASDVPARAIGVDDRKGKLAAGYDADLVILDRDLTVCATMCSGRVVYARADAPMRWM